jgi:hypothetical protein
MPTAQFTSSVKLRRPGRTIKLRIHVTGLDAMCRMIQTVGRGRDATTRFELFIAQPARHHAERRLWATRRIDLVAIFGVAVTARLLVNHLTAAAAT